MWERFFLFVESGVGGELGGSVIGFCFFFVRKGWRETRGGKGEKKEEERKGQRRSRALSLGAACEFSMLLSLS